MATRRSATLNTTLPDDVRWTNLAAKAVFVLAVLVVLGLGITALTRLPYFQLRRIVIEGDFSRSSVATIRANAVPRLQGNFFSMDLNKARAAFETVPWVRHAVVRRVWPDKLVVTLQEHQAAALWETEEGDDKLVNTQGEVFEANLGDVEDEDLPSFAGPDGSSAQMLALYEQLQPVFAQMDAAPTSLTLSRRGSWRVRLDTGTTVELGRGSLDGRLDEVLARTGRFVRTVAQVSERFEQRPIQYADLRQADGYAVRIKGITTTTIEPKGPARRR